MNEPDHIRARPSRALGVAAALAAALAFAPAARAEAPWAWERFDSLMTVAGDPARAGEITTIARSRIAGASDVSDAFMGYSLLYRVSIARREPLERIALAADSLLLACGPDIELRAGRARVMSYELGREERTRPLALRYARVSFAAAIEWDADDAMIGSSQVAVGLAHLENSAPDSAAVWLESSLGAVADSAGALALLTRAQMLRGDDARALDAGIRSLAVYQASDTSAAPAVRELWKKRHGSLKGLDAALEEARARSRRRVLAETTRVDLPAPQSDLVSDKGDTLRLADHAGEVVVIEFWGSWSGACQRALPRIESLCERYRGKGVWFIGVNVERGKSHDDWLAAMRAVMKENHITFPVVPDFGGVGVLSYLVDSFPTTVMVGREGHIRFKHSLSASADGEAILGEQIESLLK